MNERALNLVPMVVEQTSRGERAFDIFSRLLKDNITDKAYSFDQTLIPDGGYQMRVVVSDAPSHTPADARHTVPSGLTPSGGQSGPDPSQLSLWSHDSPVLAARHTIPVLKASGGQVPLVPVHVSATSQTPAAVRHELPARRK